MEKHLRDNSHFRKRLVKTTTFTATLFIVATMILSSAVPATITNKTLNEEKRIIYEGENPTTACRRDGTKSNSAVLAESKESTPLNLDTVDIIFTGGFEDTWVADSDGDLAPPGWENHITDFTDTGSPYYLPHYWGQYGEVTSYDPPAVPPEGDYQAMVQWSYNHQDEWLITPLINLSGYSDCLLSFWRYGHTGSTYGDHYYVKVSPTGGYDQEDFTDMLWDASALPEGDNHYDYPYVIDLSDYDGTSIRIAWHNEDPPSNDGLWYGGCIDDVTVYEKPPYDVGVTSINSPVSGPAGVITPEVTVENFGTADLTDVPVNMKIGYTQVVGGIYEDFEVDNGSFVASADWGTGEGDWEWTDSYDVSNYVPGPYNNIPPPVAHSGDGLWGTVLYGPYTNAGGTSSLKKTVDLGGIAGAILSFYSWADINGYFDYGTVMVNGVELFRIDTPNPTAWEYFEIDLSDYAGMSSVEISFDFYASTVVEYTGWYIDDVGIGELELVVEYNETTLTNIDAGESVDVTFPEWTPNAWQNVQDTDINYAVWAETQLVEDIDPGNDFLTEDITLHYGFFHDLATTIVNPDSGAAGTLPAEVEIENIGQYQECCYPVDISIARESPTPTSIMTEGFESYSPQVDIFPPTGWTLIQTDPTSTWFKYLPTTTMRARCQESGATGAQDEWLITDTIDCSGLNGMMMEFYRYMATPDDDYVEVLGSTDDGATWPHLIHNYTAYASSGTEIFDISSWADDESQVKIAWRWVSGALGGTDYFYFDDLWIGSIVESGVRENFDSWGPYGDNPPENWTIEDFGDEASPAWNNNDWHYYSSDDSARVYYTPSENQNERLISPKMNFSGLSGTFLEFWHYCYPSSYKVGYVEISTDNGSSWTPIDTFTSSVYGVVETYNISSWADDESEVKIRFRWEGAYGYSYWRVDDFYAGTRVTTEILTESFSEFIPESGFPPAGWTTIQVSGTDPDNNWTASDGTGTHPSGVIPYSGNAMAQYGSFYTPDFQCARLSTAAINFGVHAAKVARLNFWMYHDTGYSSAVNERVVIQASTNGINYTDLDAFYRYDGTTGWAEHTVDLSAYAAETTVYIGFLGISDYGNDMYIDDINITVITIEEEYYEIQCASEFINPGEKMLFTFPDWTPKDLAELYVGYIDYTIIAQHGLIGDNYTDNDLDRKGITLEYFHDVKVKAITEPSSLTLGDEWIGYTDGVYANALGSTTSTMIGAIRFTPTELAPYDEYILSKARFYHFDDDIPDMTHDGTLRIYDAGTASAPGSEITSEAFTVTGLGWYTVELSSPAVIDATKDIWVGFDIPHVGGGGDDQEHPMGLSDGGVTGKSFWFSSDEGATWNDLTSSYDYDFMLEAFVEEPVGLFLKPGTHPIAGLVENSGVFPENSVPINAKIYNETDDVIYSSDDTIPAINVGQEAAATFDDWTVSEPGFYIIEITSQLATDKYPENDMKSIQVGIDAEAPVTIATIVPAEPNGENEWYISNITITLEATDDMSGLDTIKYRIDGGSWKDYVDPVVISEDGEHTFEYYAIDKVGNEETAHGPIDFKVDQTPPAIELIKEKLINKLKFTAEVSDDMSGVDRVEFYLNDGIQFIDDEAPYEWVLSPIPNANITVTGVVYDLAGNLASAALTGGKSQGNNNVVSKSEPIVNIMQVQL